MENQKKINLIADIVAPIAVIAVTIALFMLFMPAEPGALFWTNLCYLVFLEVILFAYIVWLPKRGSSVVLKWMSGIYSVFYIGAGLIWMLLFSVGLSPWASMKVYYAGIMVLTVLWIFIGALTVKVDNANDIAVSAISGNRRRVSYITGQADMLLNQFNLMRKAHGKELESPSSAVTSLCRGLSTLSPAAMADPSVANRIISICEGLEELLSESVTEGLGIRIKEYADKSLIVLNSLKKSILK